MRLATGMQRCSCCGRRCGRSPVACAEAAEEIRRKMLRWITEERCLQERRDGDLGYLDIGGES